MVQSNTDENYSLTRLAPRHYFERAIDPALAVDDRHQVRVGSSLPMSEHKNLTAELRAAREELTRRERHHGTPGEGGLTPEVDPAFRRLQALSAEELTRHIERLERDLDDLIVGLDAWEDAIEDSADRPSFDQDDRNSSST